jgi:hypothetical protein
MKGVPAFTWGDRASVARVEARVHQLLMGTLEFGTQRAWSMAGAGGGNGKGGTLLNYKTCLFITATPPTLLVAPKP